MLLGVLMWVCGMLVHHSVVVEGCYECGDVVWEEDQKLTTLYGQFRSVGVNYNQTVVAMKSNFTEKKAFAMLAKLEKLTLELVVP